MRGEAVPQRVRRNILIDLRLFLIELDDLPEALPAHALAGDVHKKRMLRRIRQHLEPHVVDVGMKRLHGLRIKWNNSRLPAGLAANKAARDAHVVDIQVDEFTDADAGRVQNLEHRLVAAALHIACARLLEQKLDLFSGQDLRQLFFGLFDLDVMYRVLLDLVLR